MPRSQTVIMCTFAIITVLLVATLVYSFTYYSGVFRAMRTLTFSVADFDVKILDSASIAASTTVTLNNTSAFDFYATGITHKIFVNDFYVGTSNTQEISSNKPLRIPSQSSKNATVTLTVDFAYLSPELVEFLLTPSLHKVWLVFVYASLEGPIIGRFLMDTTLSVNASQ